MDTVNKYVNAASTALWGENNSPEAQRAAQHGDEPISGVQGRGGAMDPYDAGNREEQPGAIPSEGNTAPQDPVLGKKPEPQGGTLATHADPSTSKTADNVDVPFTKPLGAGTGLDASGSSEKPVSGGSTEATGSVEDSGKEQRSTSQSGEGESSEKPRPAVVQQASKEALEGPQGPAPKSAEDFEKEAKIRMSVSGAGGGAEKASTTSSKDHAHQESPADGRKSESSQDSGKQSSMSKVKESMKKHLHK